MVDVSCHLLVGFRGDWNLICCVCVTYLQVCFVFFVWFSLLILYLFSIGSRFVALGLSVLCLLVERVVLVLL